MTQEQIYGLLLALLGGLNIFQLLFPKIQKRKMQAEASTAEADANSAALVAMEKKMELQKAQFDYLNEQLEKALKSNYETQIARKEESERYLTEVTELRQEIVDLKSNIMDLNSTMKQMAEEVCKRPNCAKRIKSDEKKSPSKKTVKSNPKKEEARV